MDFKNKKSLSIKADFFNVFKIFFRLIQSVFSDRFISVATVRSVNCSRYFRMVQTQHFPQEYFSVKRP